jgi:hypothetical protein
MPSWMPATGAERLLWFVLIILVAGYMVGQLLNRQRSKRIGSWLQTGLGALGGRVAWKWLRAMSAGAEITVQETRPPYRNLVIGYYLLTREFAPLWLVEWLLGKRDLLSLRADLRTQPGREFDILPLKGKLRKELDAAAEQHTYQWQELANGLGLATQGQPDQQLLQRAQRFLETYGPYVERISLRRRAPHVISFMRLSGLENTKSDALWRALGELVQG